MADTPMTDAAIDPRLSEGPSQTQPQSQPQLRGNSAHLPILNIHDRDEADDDDGDGDGNEAGEKRRKLNLLKCRQCRDARKKCLPENRTWPGQKCDRCRLHKPAPLDCSKPELNTRKRGPNLSKQQAQRSDTTRSTPDRLEPRSKEKIEEDPEDDKNLVSGRPSETPAASIPKKRQREQSPPKESPAPAPGTKDDQQHPPSAYKPLGDNEFRILLLQPGRGEDEIVCSFEKVNILEPPPKYEAISYLYGGGARQTSVRIKLRDDNGKFHYISHKSNLCDALRNLRHRTEIQAYWADAICINHNNEEKSRQVELKRDIFRNAANVCFWLGEDPNDKVALEFIPKILKLTEVDKLVRFHDEGKKDGDDEAIDGWVAFVGLLNNPVFSRLWFVQEVAVAQNVTVHCGIPAVHYNDLADAVAMFISFRDSIALLFRQKNKKVKDLWNRQMSTAECFIDVSINALRPSSSGTMQRLLSLEALVSRLTDLSATDPRDRIFSVWAIAKDGPPLVGKTLMEVPKGKPSVEVTEGNPQIGNNQTISAINYRKTISDVYQDFVVHAIRGSKSLDIICRNWASSLSKEVASLPVYINVPTNWKTHSEEIANLPTWVRPLQFTFQQPFISNVSERVDADSLVGLPGHNVYNASGSEQATPQTESILSSDPNRSVPLCLLLQVQGFRVDTIHKLGPRSSEGIIPYEWVLSGGCNINEATVPDEFWRTLVADRGPDGSTPPSWYRRAFLFCLQQLTPSGNINTTSLMAEFKVEASLVAKFLRRVQSVIWNRKLLISRKKKWIGLAPMAAEAGDIICVLHGCSVPVLLRPPEDDEDTAFQLVGECYVHGIMDGEALDDKSYKLETFRLK